MVRMTNSTDKFTYARWCTEGDTEVFDLKSDPWQTVNLAGHPGWPEQVITDIAPLAVALAQCSGPSCSAPELAAGLNTSFPCYEAIPGKTARQGAFNFVFNKSTQMLQAIKGWAIDFRKDGPG